MSAPCGKLRRFVAALGAASAIIAAACLLPFCVYAQQPTEWGGWHLQGISGELSMEQRHEKQEDSRQGVASEKQEASELIGGIDLNSSSYILHPNFLTLDVGGKYSPGNRHDNYLTAPDRMQSNTDESLNVRSTLFAQRPFSVSNYYDYSHSFVNRELLTGLDTKRYNYGSTINYRNELLPFSMRYSHEDWKDHESETNHDFTSLRDSAGFEANRSFTSYDTHNFSAAIDDYSRSYITSEKIDSQVLTLNLSDQFYFDKEKDDRYQSRIWYYDQTGDFALERAQVDQDVTYHLSPTLRSIGNYEFLRISRDNYSSDRNGVRAMLEHKLFESLTSHLGVEYSKDNETLAQEDISKANTGFEYTKQIPTGAFNLSYNLGVQSDNRQSEGAGTPVVHETIVLRDGDTVLLERPSVIASSIVVRDQTGTIIYVEGVDYILVAHGDYSEIQRLPGGLISNGMAVFVEYETSSQSSFDLNSINQQVFTGLSLLKGALHPYARYNRMDNTSVQTTAFRALQEYQQTIFGLDGTWSVLSGGVKFDRYESTIVPYESTQYYLGASKMFRNKLLMALSSNYRSNLLTDEDERQRFVDFAGRLSYFFTTKMKLDVALSNRLQRGQDIDLDLTTLRAEFITQYRNATLTLGYENYHRDLMDDVTNYDSYYVKLSRKFGW